MASSPTPPRSRTASTAIRSSPKARTTQRSSRTAPQPIARGPCFICGTKAGPFQSNHVAGFPNAPRAEVPLCVPCHEAFTALQRSAGIVKPGRKGLEYPPMSSFGKVAALAQGGILHLILAARQRDLGQVWEKRIDQLSRDVTDLAAHLARETGSRVPLPDPLTDEGNPA